MLILGLKRLTLSLPECLMEFCKVTLTFQSVDEILWCDHSNERSLPVLTHGAICFSQFWKMKFGNLVETCLWPHLALKGLRKPLKWPASWECHLIIILNRLTNVKVNNLLSGGGRGGTLIWSIRGYASGQVMVFELSILNGALNIVGVCPNQSTQFRARVLPVCTIWFARWILFELQGCKSNDFYVNLLYSNYQ